MIPKWQIIHCMSEQIQRPVPQINASSTNVLPFLMIIYSASFGICLLHIEYQLGKSTCFRSRRSGQIHVTSKRKQLNPVSGWRSDMTLTLDTETTSKVTAHILTKYTLKVMYRKYALDEWCQTDGGRTNGWSGHYRTPAERGPNN